MSRYLIYLLVALPFCASGDAWPKEILVNSGKLQVRFESRSFWTLYRVVFDNHPIGIDHFGSHYGSVAMFKGVGFIGSGHRENEDEKVDKLKLWVDGKEITSPVAEYTCESFRLKKWSSIKTLDLVTDIVVKNDQIHESVTVSAREDTPVSLIYHFMHPWATSMTNYMAETSDGKSIEDSFVNDNQFRINKKVKWSAVYDSQNQAGAVIINQKTPDDAKSFTKYWDHSERYKKHYLQSFSNQTVKAGIDYTFSIDVIPFTASIDTWKKKVLHITKK